MATDIIARGMITEYIAGTNINFTENRDGTVEISASGSISSEDSVARDAIGNHKSDTSNPHNVTPAQIGLGNVDNTSDLDKPISTAVQQAIDNKADKTVATTSADGLMSAEDKGKLDSADDTYALKSKYGDTTIDVGRKADTTVGFWSTAEGSNTTASGQCSHAEGDGTTASGGWSHAEGSGTIASKQCAHAEGVRTTASGANSHAEGQLTTASGANSHAGGWCTEALHDNEVSYGKYNKSSSDTLFSVGDGTSDSARHNAFEITTTGGKLHDKDIATTDIIPDLSEYAKKVDVPNIKVNSAVNADTVGGKEPEKIFYDNGLTSDLDSATKSGCYAASPDTLNAPLSSWWLVDTVNFDNQFIVQKAHAIGDTSTTVSYIRNYANGAWSDWTEMYTSGNKPYVTGSSTVTADTMVCVTNHGFMPSAAIYWNSSKFGMAISVSTTDIATGWVASENTVLNYMIFK